MYWTLLPYLYKVIDGEKLFFLYIQQHLSWKKQFTLFALIVDLFFYFICPKKWQ